MAVGSASTWDASTAIAHCPTQPWTGQVWRYHSSKYAGDDASGSLKMSGRFNQGVDKFPSADIWMVLYASLGRQVALGERIRHTTSSTLAKLANQRESRLRAELHVVLNLCAPGGYTEFDVVGLDAIRMCDPRIYTPTQKIAQIARNRVEALLVPSCTRYPEGNLIIFRDRLLPGSVLHVEETVDPDLFIDWDSVT